MALDLETIQNALENEWNTYVAVRIFQQENGADYVRVTDGSDTHYVDIYPDGETLKLKGENHGEVINTSCAAEKDHLIGCVSNKFLA